MQEVVSLYTLCHTRVLFIVMLIGKGNNRPSLCLIVCTVVSMYVWWMKFRNKYTVSSHGGGKCSNKCSKKSGNSLPMKYEY